MCQTCITSGVRLSAHAFTPTHDIPVVEDLGAHDVPADAPAILVAALPKPIVAQNLYVKVVYFKRRVVNM